MLEVHISHFMEALTGEKTKAPRRALYVKLPDLFGIGKPDLPVVLMSTVLSDLVGPQSWLLLKLQMFPKGRCSSGKEEKPIGPLTLPSTF